MVINVRANAGEPVMFEVRCTAEILILNDEQHVPIETGAHVGHAPSWNVRISVDTRPGVNRCGGASQSTEFHFRCFAFVLLRVLMA
jgi:hypothetical protein